MADDKKKYYKDLEDLPGIGEVTAEKLRAAGYGEFSALAAAAPHDLAETAGMGVESAKKAIEAAKTMVEIGFESADVVLERRKNIAKIKTGSDALDELLGGGVETMAITEMYGKFSSGKSQLGFQLTVNAQKSPEEGGLGGGVLFIDTEATFRPERIVQLAEAQGMDPQQVLKNIHIARAENTDHQIILAERAGELIENHNIKLIVVDSLTSQFRAEYLGRGALGERQQKLNKHVHMLQKLAEKYNVAVYITNQVMDNPGILFGDPTTPIGGHILAHSSTYRLYVRKSKEDKRIARLVDSPNLPEGEAVFRVTPKGLTD
ncbi:DNA repair and recombination protein RadA [Candidatus Micrarchaeota archaeon]|nr:DNA repair and recombination protein RadA [Candidatus Micrarchaeota archaeon]MBU1166367.1 DNA repair and recombination protein RadA [Candidatus Micrarchaeota archaeon]MBU1886891.1 DNA repair and recombination protein RadA [Candidatus Micrarchaeota archaeon]